MLNRKNLPAFVALGSLLIPFAQKGPWSNFASAPGTYTSHEEPVVDTVHERTESISKLFKTYPGILYLKTTALADAAYGDGVDLRSRGVAIESVTKLATALVWYELIKQPMLNGHKNNLSLDTPIGTILHEAQGAISRVTIRELLNHKIPLTSEPLLGVDPYDRSAVTTAILRLDPAGPPKYSNRDFNLLLILAEVASGRPFCDLLKEFVLDPAGIRSFSFYEASDKKSVPRIPYTAAGATGLIISVVDATKLLERLAKVEPAVLKELKENYLNGSGLGINIVDLPDGRSAVSVSGSGIGPNKVQRRIRVMGILGEPICTVEFFEAGEDQRNQPDFKLQRATAANFATSALAGKDALNPSEARDILEKLDKSSFAGEGLKFSLVANAATQRFDLVVAEDAQRVFLGDAPKVSDELHELFLNVASRYFAGDKTAIGEIAPNPREQKALRTFLEMCGKPDSTFCLTKDQVGVNQLLLGRRDGKTIFMRLVWEKKFDGHYSIQLTQPLAGIVQSPRNPIALLPTRYEVVPCEGGGMVVVNCRTNLPMYRIEKIGDSFALLGYKSERTLQFDSAMQSDPKSK